MQRIAIRSEDQNRRRSVADVLATFADRERREPGDHAALFVRAGVRVSAMKIEPDAVVGLVWCEFVCAECEPTFIITLPTSVAFWCVLNSSSERVRFDIAKLDEAKIFSCDDVRLKDGTQIRAVEVVPAKLPYELSDFDCRIIRLAVDKTGEFDRCYPDMFANLRKTYPELPELRVLDFSRLTPAEGQSRLEIAPLKVLQADFLKANPDVKTISRQKIADALAKAGLRAPIRRGKRRSGD